MGLPKRKPNRLPGYDYGSPGAYFVTGCTRGRRGILSRISVGEGLAPPDLRLTECGRIVERNIFEIEKRFNFTVDKYNAKPCASAHIRPGMGGRTKALPYDHGRDMRVQIPERGRMRQGDRGEKPLAAFLP